jgi:ribosome-binding factor A
VTVRRRTATYPRALRVNQVLRQVVAEELERLADADELPMLTVTSVEVAADMRTAMVYLSSLDEASADALEERRGRLQRLIGAQMTMKRTPRLSFRADPAIESGTRVEELLRGLHAHDGAGADDDAGAGAEEHAARGDGEGEGSPAGGR